MENIFYLLYLFIKSVYIFTYLNGYLLSIYLELSIYLLRINLKNDVT